MRQRFLVLLLICCLPVPPAVADLRVKHGGRVGSKLNGSLNGACRRGICRLSGGSRKGKNKNILLHRLDKFDTRGGAIKRLKINNSTGKVRTVVLSVTNPRGTFLTVPTRLKRRSDLVLLSPGGIQVKNRVFNNIGSLSLIAKPSFKIDNMRFNAIPVSGKSIKDQSVSPGKINIRSNLSVDGNLLIDSYGEILIQDSKIKASDSIRLVSSSPRQNTTVRFEKQDQNRVVLLNSSLAAARGNLDIDVDRRFLDLDNQTYQSRNLNGQASAAPAIQLHQSDLDAGGTMRLHARVNDHPGGMIPSILEIDASDLQSSRLLSIKGVINTNESLKNSIAVALTGRSSFSSDHQIRILGLFDSGVDLARSEAVSIDNDASIRFYAPVKIIGRITDFHTAKLNTAILLTDSDVHAFDDILFSARTDNYASLEDTRGIQIQDSSLHGDQINSLSITSDFDQIDSSIDHVGVGISESNINNFYNVKIDAFAKPSRVRVAGSLGIWLDQVDLQAGSIRFNGVAASGEQRSDSFVRADQTDSAQLEMPSANSANSGVSINNSRLIAERDIEISGVAGKYQSVFTQDDLNPFGAYIFESDLDSGRLISVYGNAGSSYAGQASLATGVHLLNANLSSFKIDLIGHGGDIFYTGQQAAQLRLDGNEGLLIESSSLSTSPLLPLQFNASTQNSIQLAGYGGDIQSLDDSRYRFDVDAMNGISILDSEFTSGDTAVWFGESGKTSHGSDLNRGIYIENADIFFYDENIDRDEVVQLIGASQSGTNDNNGVLVFESTFISPNSDLAFVGQGAQNSSQSGELNRGVVFADSVIYVGTTDSSMGRIQDPYNNGNHDLTIVGAGGQGLMDNDGVADFNSDINVTGDILVDGSVMSSGENNASTVWIDTSLSAGGDLLIEGNTDSVFDQALINVQGDLNVVVDGAFVDHPSLVHSANTSLDADLAINSFSTQNVSDLNQIRVESLNAVQLDGRDIQNSIENSEAALFSALGSIVQTSFSTPLTLKDMQLMLKNEMRMIQNRP